jgi:hypothetical protein
MFMTIIRNNDRRNRTLTIRNQVCIEQTGIQISVNGIRREMVREDWPRMMNGLNTRTKESNGTESQRKETYGIAQKKLFNFVWKALKRDELQQGRIVRRQKDLRSVIH